MFDKYYNKATEKLLYVYFFLFFCLSFFFILISYFNFNSIDKVHDDSSLLHPREPDEERPTKYPIRD